jgi:hypothetical protein
MPDIPQVLSPPSISNIQALNIVGSLVPQSTFFVRITSINAWGETLPSNELSVTVGAGQNAFSVDFQTALGSIPINNRLYIGISSNGEASWLSFSGTTGTIQVTNINPLTSVGGTTVSGSPPTRSSAFLPDTDGRFASAGTWYRWLNSALNTAAYVCKGIPDTSGIQMIQQQGMYTMPGVWTKLDNMWFDGYPLAADARGGGFYRNVLNGISFIIILQTNSDRQIIELQPQPNRTGGNTTLSVAAGITDSQLSLVSTASIALSLGMAQIGTGPNAEVVSYGTLGGPGMIGVARGLGGTQQQAWPIGTPVIELNFRFGGLRLNQQVQYQPGQSLISLQVPPGWKPALVDYILGKAREGERKGPEAKEYLQKFSSFLKDYVMGTRQTAGPRQLGSVTPAGDGYPSASSGGRIIVP